LTGAAGGGHGAAGGGGGAKVDAWTRRLSLAVHPARLSLAAVLGVNLEDGEGDGDGDGSGGDGAVSGTPLAHRIACLQTCVKRLEETMGNNYTRLMKAVNGADLVGVNILLVMGSGIVDGINDTGRNKSDIVWGHGGILGKYEGAQLFLSAPVTNKFEIVTMIDRYEGEPESWEPPGSATPDREAGSTSEFAVNPREPSLKARLSREVPGDKQQMKTIPRERWS
jgi:hypothetical protein